MATRDDLALEKSGGVTTLPSRYIALGLILPVALLALIALQLYTEWRRLGHEVEVNTLTIARILADHTDRLLETADLVRVQTAELVGAEGPLEADQAQFRQLNRFAAAAPHIASIWVGDAEGRAVLTSRQFPAPPLSAQSRSYFTAVRDNPDALHVGNLIDNRYSDAVLITTSRRIPSADGSFRGFIQIALDPEYIRNTFDGVRLPYQASLWWIAPDGSPLLREPMVPIETLPQMVPQAYTGHHGQPFGSFRGISPMDGGERLYYFRTSPEYGNVILVGVRLDDLRGIWWERIQPTLILGALLLAALIALTRFVGRERMRGLAHRAELEREVRARTRALDEAVEQKELVLRELRHRVGNAYATIQALAQQMLRTSEDFESFKQSFPRRLQSLAATQTMLVNAEDRGASVGDLVWAELGPYRARDGDGARVEGPAVALTGSRAVALGLVLHELVTNSVKYGALSVPEGRVSVRWQVEDGASLVLEWVEAAGPPIADVSRRGFGSEMIARATQLCGGDIALEYAPEGVRARVTLPLEAGGR